MRGARVALIAALLALVGCKSGADKSGDDKSHGGVAGRPKGKDKDKDKDKDAPTGKGPTWLDDVSRLPGAGTSIPKGTGVTDPKNPNFDPKTAAQDALGGRVVDADGKPAEEVFVRIQEVGVTTTGLAGRGIYTLKGGYFFATGWEPGRTYELTAQATRGGQKLVGTVQTKVPNALLLIVLRDDLPPPAKGSDGGVFPPTPSPSDKVGESVPPAGTPPKAKDGEWSPTAPTTGVPPTTIGGTPKPPATGGAVPQPDDLSAPPPKAVKPENVADGKKEPFTSPPVNIPGSGPPVPTLPTLPPSFTPPPGGRSSMGSGNVGDTVGKVTLVDTLDRPLDVVPGNAGRLVLVEFMTSNCKYCPDVIPVLRDLQGRYGASGLQVAAVLCDDAPSSQRIAAAAKYHRDFNLNYNVYVEPDGAGSVWSRKDINVPSYPYAILVNSTGRILWNGHPGKRVELESAIKQNLGK